MKGDTPTLCIEGRVHWTTIPILKWQASWDYTWKWNESLGIWLIPIRSICCMQCGGSPCKDRGEASLQSSHTAIQWVTPRNWCIYWIRRNWCITFPLPIWSATLDSWVGMCWYWSWSINDVFASCPSPCRASKRDLPNLCILESTFEY